MSRFFVEIQLDHPLEPNKTGGVSGTLRIETREECKCRKLVLYCQSGSPEPEKLDKKKAKVVTVAKWETWEAGEEYSYPFHFEANGSWTGISDQEGSTIEWLFLPEIHITGEFKPDTSAGWIPAKINLKKPKSYVRTQLDDGEEDTPGELQTFEETPVDLSQSYMISNIESPISVVDAGEMPEDPDEAIAWLERIAEEQEKPAEEGPNLENEIIDQTNKNVNLISAELADALDELEGILEDLNGKETEKLTATEGYIIRVNFNKNDRKYRIGEKITGNIIVRAFREFEIDWLRLVYQWRTHGRAELEKGNLNQITVAENVKWQAGQLYGYRFNFVIDDGPLTNRGYNRNVDWYIWTEMKLSYEQTTHYGATETELILLPPIDLLKVRVEPLSIFWRVVSKFPPLLWPIGLLITLIVILLILLFFLTMETSTEQQGVLGICIFLYSPIFVITLIAGLFTVRYQLAETKLGHVDVQIETIPDTYALCGLIRFFARREVFVSKVILKIKVWESVRVRQGTGYSWEKRLLETMSEIEDIDKRVDPNKLFEASVNMPITRALPMSFNGISRRIEWRLEVRINNKGWFNWRREFPITVSR